MIRERREVVKLYASERERVKKRRPATKRARKRRDFCCALPMSSFSLPSFSSAFVYAPLSDARAVAFCDQARRPPHMYESRRALSSKILSRTVRVHRSMRALSLSHRSARASPPTHSPEGCEITTCQCLIGYVVASVRGASEGGRGGFCCSAGCSIGVLGAEPAPARPSPVASRSGSAGNGPGARGAPGNLAAIRPSGFTGGGFIGRLDSFRGVGDAHYACRRFN